jgi:WD40 repeat protein
MCSRQSFRCPSRQQRHPRSCISNCQTHSTCSIVCLYLLAPIISSVLFSITTFGKLRSLFETKFLFWLARSTSHMYVSALPFAPTSSLILDQYLHHFPRTLNLARGQLSHWPVLEMTIQTHRMCVKSIAFSPDGQRIASGSGLACGMPQRDRL